LLGVATGIAIGANRLANDIVTPIIVALYSIPKIIFLPVLLMIFGTGAPPKIANAAMHAFFPVVLNSLVGMGGINPLHVKTARSMLASPLQVVAKIYLPGMVLPVLAGIRLGLGLAFLGALLAELFESTNGVGHFVTQLYNEGRIAEMLAVIIALFLLLLVLITGIKTFEARLSRWREA
jgi:NitT/TauT family transport system permease protein